jgi:hypothetical protein
MTVLALKLLLAPLLVVASSLAGRRWGPRVAGILVVLPIVAGPILLILYLDHGSGFAAAAARAATLAIVPLALFALIFAYVSRNRGWLLTLLASWVAVLLADLALAQIHVPAIGALLLALLALHAAGALLRRLGQPPPSLVPTPVVGSPCKSGRNCSSGCAGDWGFGTAPWPRAGARWIRDVLLSGCCLGHRLSALAAFGSATAAAVIFAIFLAARGAGSN